MLVGKPALKKALGRSGTIILKWMLKSGI